MTAPHSSALAYRADIDGLRAVAVLLVLVFHFELLSAGKAGFLGVDVFFVISGFLITALVRRQLDEGRFRLGEFYLNRIRRLAPALVAVLLGTMAAGALLLFPLDLIELMRQAAAAQFYVANIYFWRSVNYFGLSSDNVFLLHTWSLAVEEQFYLLYAPLLMLVHKRLRAYFWWALLLAALLSLALSIGLSPHKPEASFYLLPTRAWELLAGALVPWIAARWTPSQTRAAWLGSAGFGLIALAVLSYRREIAFPGGFALLPVVGAVLLLIAGTSPRNWTARLLSTRVPVYIGKISYPLYLVHWPVHVFAQQYFGQGYGPLVRWSMFGLSIVLAALVYHAVEQPIRSRRWFPAARGLGLAYAVGLVAVALACWGVVQGQGLPQRFPKAVIELAAYADDHGGDPTACEFKPERPNDAQVPCLVGVAGVDPQWLVFGDSHAGAARPAVQRWLEQKGQAGVFMFRNSCPPLLGVHVFKDRGVCARFNRLMFERARDTASLRGVLLVSTWLQAPEARLTPDPDAAPTVQASLALFDRALPDTVAQLHALGRQVYVWEPVPGARGNVPLGLAKQALGRGGPELRFSHDEYRQTYRFFFDALERSRDRVSLSFSPSQALCGSGMCEVTIPGAGGRAVPVYSDNSHITHSSAEFWAQFMRETEQRVVGAASAPVR